MQPGIKVVSVQRRQVGEHGGPLGGQSEPIAEQRRAQSDGDGEAGGAQPVGLPGVRGRLHLDLRLYGPDRLALLQDRGGGRPARQQRLQLSAARAAGHRERHEHGVPLWGRVDSALVGLAVEGIAAAQIDGVIVVPALPAAIA